MACRVRTSVLGIACGHAHHRSRLHWRHDYTDDLRLAHVLADDADSITAGPVQGAGPARDEQARPDPGHRRRPGRRGGHPAHAVAGPLPRRRHRRGAGHDRPQPAPLDRRPDRRHQELRPRRAGLGDPHRARRRRRGRARRGLGSAAPAALVGLDGQRRLDRPVAAQGDPVRGLRRTPTRGRLAVATPPSRAGTSAAGSTTSSSLSRRCWRTRAYGDFWSYMLLAEGAVDIAAEPELELYDMAALDVIVREAGGRFTSLDGTDGPLGGNALATNGHLHEAALSFLGSMPDDEDDPDVPRRGPGSVQRPPRPPGDRPSSTEPIRTPRTRPVRPPPDLTTVMSQEPATATQPPRGGDDADQRRAHTQAQPRRRDHQPRRHRARADRPARRAQRRRPRRQRRRRRASTASSASATSYAACTPTTPSSKPGRRDHDRRRRTCAGEDDLTDLMQMMTEHRIRHVPVVDRRTAHRHHQHR